MKKGVFTTCAAVMLFAWLAGPAVAKRVDQALLDKAIPIEEAVEKATSEVPNAKVVEAELDDDEGGRWELKLVDKDGKVSKIRIDAASGEVTGKTG